MRHPLLLFVALVFVTGSSLAQDRQIARDFFEAGELAYLGGRFAESLDHYNRGLAIDAGHYEAYPSRAAVRERLGDWNGAVTDYNIFLEVFPENREVRFGRGLARYHAGQFDFAEVDFRYLLETPSSGETHTIFYRQSPMGGGTDRIISMQGNIRDHIFNYLGLAIYEQGNLSESISNFDSAIQLNPNEPDYFVHRGLARQDNGDAEGAEADYRTALKLDPGHSIAYHNLSILLKSKGGKESRELLDKAIENNPDLSYPYIERGYHLLEQEDYTGALRDYNKALELDPLSPENWLNRGLAKEKLGDLAGAYQDFTRAITLAPQLEKAWLSRANILTKQERFAEALEDYSVAITYYPEYGIAWLNRAIVHHRLGRKDAACADVRKAASLGVKGTERLMKAVCGSGGQQ